MDNKNTSEKEPRSNALRSGDFMTRSIFAGAKAGAVAGAVSFGVLKYLEATSARFRSFRLNAGARTAIVFTPVAFSFTVFSEQNVLREANPAWFPKKKASSLPLHEKCANWVYGHPVQSLILSAVPGYGLIFHATRDQKHLSFSQRIIHTRVIGQAYVLTTVLILMGFMDFMDKRGEFTTGE
jgi:hypothetical protein